MNEFAESFNKSESQLNITQSYWMEVEKFAFLDKTSPSQSTTASSSILLLAMLFRRLSESERPSEQIEPPHLSRYSVTERMLSGVSWTSHFLPSKPLEFRQPPETRWVQNLRNPAYHLRQPIPLVIERVDDTVTATYDDVNLHGAGDSVSAAISQLCTKIVAHYEELKKSNAKTPEIKFLTRIIEEVEPSAWQELKQLYKEKLEEIPYVQEGYIDISAPEYADVILVLSEYSVDRIEQLAEIDLELNLKFRPLHFFVEYESSEDHLEVGELERFY